MADDLELYPVGQVGFGSGDLKKATLARWSLTNGATLRHSLAQSPSGISQGQFEITFSIEFEVSEKGLERDVVTDIMKGTPRNFRFKCASDQYQIKGVFNQVDWEAKRPDPTKVTASGIGKLII
jgi:hypothetical protein